MHIELVENFIFKKDSDVVSVVTRLIRRQQLVSTALTQSINVDVDHVRKSVDVNTLRA